MSGPGRCVNLNMTNDDRAGGSAQVRAEEQDKMQEIAEGGNRQKNMFKLLSYS